MERNYGIGRGQTGSREQFHFYFAHYFLFPPQKTSFFCNWSPNPLAKTPFALQLKGSPVATSHLLPAAGDDATSVRSEYHSSRPDHKLKRRSSATFHLSLKIWLLSSQFFHTWHELNIVQMPKKPRRVQPELWCKRHSSRTAVTVANNKQHEPTPDSKMLADMQRRQ